MDTLCTMSTDVDRITQLVFSIPQTQLAAEIGVDPSYLSAVRNGRRYPSVKLLRDMRDVLNKRIEMDSPAITLDEITEWVDGMVKMRESVCAV